jgi:hypothetical protein
MKFEIVKVPHIKFQQNLWKGWCDTPRNPFMPLCKEFYYDAVWMENNCSTTIDGSLSHQISTKSPSWQFLMKVSHAKFKQNLWNDLWDTWNSPVMPYINYYGSIWVKTRTSLQILVWICHIKFKKYLWYGLWHPGEYFYGFIMHYHG